MINFLNRQVRITDPEVIDKDLITKELQNGSHVIVQFSEEHYYLTLLDELNVLCSTYTHNFAVRFFGHYNSTFNCNFLLKIPNVKALYIDCLEYADNLEVITLLKELKMISIDIYNIDYPEILNSDNFRFLEILIISGTKKSINLEYLKKCKELKALIISGKTRNIDTIGDVVNLEFLSLNSISGSSLNFINRLKKLNTLKIILGGRDNINEIEMNNIETLELIRVRGLNNLDNLNLFKGLRNLLIEDQIQISQIHFQSNLDKLEDLKLLNCKQLNSISGLVNLESLKQIRIYKTNIDFNSLINDPLPKSLKIFGFFTTKAKKDKQIEKTLLNMGYNLI